MKAAILTSQGDPTVLSIIDDYPEPQIAKGHEVLIKVKAIAISSADLMTRRGFTAGPAITPPQIIGTECIGVVEAVSPELERAEDRAETRIGRHGAKYRTGDVVIALMGGMGRMFDGCYAEYVALPPICLSAPLLEVARLSMPLISDSSPAQPSPSYGLLAAIPGAFLVAYGVLIKSLKIRATDTLLVHGGSSAIGMAIALMAKNFCGLKKIVGTTRSKAKPSKMQAGGFDTVIVLPKEPTLSSTAEEISDKIKREGGQLSGFTAIVDLIGAANIPISLLCADRRDGAIVCMAGMLEGAYHFVEPFSPMGIPPGVFLTGYSSSVEEHLLPLSNIVKDVLESRINPVVDKVFAFKDIVEAHKYYESGVVSNLSRSSKPASLNTD